MDAITRLLPQIGRPRRTGSHRRAAALAPTLRKRAVRRGVYHRRILILLRHGRTPNNAQARLQGQSDAPLDEVGLEQSAVVGQALRERWPVDRVVVSSRRRTRQTARAAGLADTPTNIDDRWMEIDFGAYDDRRISEVMAELGAAWAADISYVPPGGESMACLHERVGEAVAEIAEEASKRNIVVVTHATPVKSAVAWLLGGGAEMIMRLRVSLASVTAFGPVEHGLVLTEFNWCPARHISQRVEGMGSSAGL